jgi:predicted nucleotidyltransferase component of viral defense system
MGNSISALSAGPTEPFKVLVQFPWRGNVPCSIKLEITVDEPVLLAVEARPLIHGYGEQLVANLTCYSLEEIVAEKLRTLLQARKRLEERRWTRNCARDYYDLWWLGTNPEFVVEWPAAIGVLAGKCAIRDVAYSSSDDFFVDDIVAEARRQWESSLRDLVGQLPSFDMMIATLRSRIDALM